MSFDSIPQVSLAEWRAADADRAAIAARVRRICHEIGFFTLVDHGIEPDWIDRYFAALQSFFALPDDTKAIIDKQLSPHFRGWERVGAELTDNRVDFREQLDLSTEYPPRQVGPGDPAYLRLDGPNQWLPEHELPGFRALVEEFLARMGALADELMQLFEAALELPAGTFAERFGERPLSFTKLIHYPTTPPGEAGVNGHHDAGFVTILLQHEVGGLQAMNPDGEWIDVPPTPGAFVINLGENLQALTGNYFVATKHRVIAPVERYSTAYFHGPDLCAPLHPLELAASFRDAVAASPRHAGAGFMAKRQDLLAGATGTVGAAVAVYGEQLWNYYVRSYPHTVASHYPDAAG